MTCQVSEELLSKARVTRHGEKHTRYVRFQKEFVTASDEEALKKWKQRWKRIPERSLPSRGRTKADEEEELR